MRRLALLLAFSALAGAQTEPKATGSIEGHTTVFTISGAAMVDESGYREIELKATSKAVTQVVVAAFY